MSRKKRIISLVLLSSLMFWTTVLGNSADAYADDIGPYVMVSAYEVSNGTIIPGETFDFVVTVQNADSEYTATNVIVSVETVDGINTIYPSVPQVYVGDLGPKAEKSVTFSFKMASSYRYDTASFYTSIISDLNENSIVLSAPVEYDGNSFTVLSKNIPEEAAAGEKISTSLYFRLRSETNLSNVQTRAFVDGMEVASNTIGNVMQGASKTQNISFTIDEIGKHNLIIQIEGVDQNGSLQVTEAYNGNIEVKEAVQTEEPDNTVVNMRPKRDYAIFAGSFVVILLLIGGIVLVLRKNKR